jgi:hypothetical protein
VTPPARSAGCTTSRWTPRNRRRGHTQDLATLCANVLDLCPALSNFTKHPDIDATYNRAERAICHAVLSPKTSTAAQTPDSDPFARADLTIPKTCAKAERIEVEIVCI